MSAPDREIVRAAMVQVYDRTDAEHEQIRRAKMGGAEAILAANARYVAEKLRELTVRLELSGELTTRSAGAIAAMADQLDPKPVSKP